MKKINKFKIIFIILFFSILSLITKSFASENFGFLSLKNDRANVRVGPSREYPIKFTYKKKHLPLKVLDKSETWRKIKDFENNSGWIHVSQLSRKKTAINIKNNSIIYKKPTIFSKPIAKLEIGRLLLIAKCKVEWCKIKSGEYEGWILKNYLWGKVK